MENDKGSNSKKHQSRDNIRGNNGGQRCLLFFNDVNKSTEGNIFLECE